MSSVGSSRKDWRRHSEGVGKPMRRFTLLCALLLCTVVALGAATSRAAVPGTAAAQPPRPGGNAQPLEGGPAAKPGPYLTGPPSAQVALDPHWRANVRANTD